MYLLVNWVRNGFKSPNWLGCHRFDATSIFVQIGLNTYFWNCFIELPPILTTTETYFYVVPPSSVSNKYQFFLQVLHRQQTLHQDITPHSIGWRNLRKLRPHVLRETKKLQKNWTRRQILVPVHLQALHTKLASARKSASRWKKRKPESCWRIVFQRKSARIDCRTFEIDGKL